MIGGQGENYSRNMVMKEAPHIILHIHPKRNINVVRNCSSATQALVLSTITLAVPFGRTFAQQKTVVPDRNVPGII